MSGLKSLKYHRFANTKAMGSQMIRGANHFTITVSNLETSFQFYRDVLGFQPLMKHSRGAYFLAGDFWFCLELTDLEINRHDDSHFAFDVEAENFESLAHRIQASGARLWKENKSEGDSLYFLDPDGHKFEIHVGDWKSRLQAAREKPWGQNMEFFK